MGLITCSDCKKEISDSAESCPNSGIYMNISIKCPDCKSTNVQKISTANHQ